jgi:diguanylate cyclase (GGDEF)-like protein
MDGLYHEDHEQVKKSLLEKFARERDNEIQKKLINTLINRITLMGNKLRAEEYRFRTVVETMTEGVVVQDKQGTIVASNKSAETILGLTAEQMAGRNSIDPRWRSIHRDGSDFPGHAHPAMMTLQTGKAYFDVIMGVHKPDRILTWITINSQPLGKVTAEGAESVVTTFTDITSLIESEEKFKTLSGTDNLTGLLNRREFSERIKIEIDRAKRNKRKNSIIMLDIDHFKKINDTHGHSTGDSVLILLSTLIRDNLRKSDISARWGGEEFMVFLPDTSGLHGKGVAEKLRKIIQDYAFPVVGKVTASFGVGEHLPDEEITVLLDRVDKALYQSKQTGRNRVTYD